MRVVLDTNVLVSAALKQRSTPGTAVLVIKRHHVPLKSHATGVAEFVDDIAGEQRQHGDDYNGVKNRQN